MVSQANDPLKVICNVFFGKIDEKVVSSGLLQHKPIHVTNFDKLHRKMLKRSLVVLLV